MHSTYHFRRCCVGILERTAVAPWGHSASAIYNTFDTQHHTVVMATIETSNTAIADVVIIEPKPIGDVRGYFAETYRSDIFDAAVGRHISFVQENQSKSRRGVVRGLHFQRGAAAQGKLVRVVSGSVLDVAVDIRRGSPTFGQYVAVELSEYNMRQLWVPRGFAHGFAVLSEQAVFQYKCDRYYHPEAEAAIAWDDPDIGIDWRLNTADVLLSDKDRHHPRLCQIPEDVLFDYNQDLYAL